VTAGAGAVALAEQLTRAIALDGAWVDERAEALAPGLTAAVSASTSVVRRASGREDLACVGAPSPAMAAVADTFTAAPFVLLLSADRDQHALAGAAAELAAAFEELYVHVDPAGPWLLAPLARLLAAEALTGDWRGAAAWSAQILAKLGALPHGEAGASHGDHRAPHGEAGPSRGDHQAPLGEAELTAMWGQALADRRAITTLERAIAAERTLLRDARRDLRRAGAEAELQAVAHRHELAALRRTLEDERAWAAEQAQRIGDSRAWRLGHGATRLAWRLTGRQVRGGDLPARIVARMQGPGPR
jgi:hypothetical protein